MEMQKNLENFIQSNSPDGALTHTQQGKDFLQSEEWRKFQESVGRKIYNISSDDFWANVVEHSLPIVGKYFYIPRGPICHPERAEQAEGSNKFNKLDSSTSVGMTNIIDLAKKEKAGWIRIEPATQEILKTIKNNIKLKIQKAPHDMQPKEILVMDIAKPEKELLIEMKQKTRYNIKLAQKHGVSVKVISNNNCHPERAERVEGSSEFKEIDPSSASWRIGMTNNYIDEFIRLVKITAKRDKIDPHPENYYRKMFETIPKDILKLYVAEYQGKVIAANLIVFSGKTATYLHGASDNSHRNLMAPYLLQWQAIKDAKMVGCEKYDLGGIHTKTGEGITKFKTGFAPNTQPIEFPGSYDIVLNPTKYYLYKIMQKIKSIL